MSVFILQLSVYVSLADAVQLRKLTTDVCCTLGEMKLVKKGKKTLAMKLKLIEGETGIRWSKALTKG